MADIATLAVKLILDAANFSNGLQNAEKDLRAWAQGASATLKDIGGGMVSAGKSLTAFATLPILAAGAASLKYASDLEETKNKASVVFGEMSADVLKWSESSATTYGISRQKALDYASSVGAALTAGGMEATQAAALSEQAVKNFADLASFHNAEVSDVAVAWQSAIRGQFEGVQRYFPFINSEYLRTYGIANGLLDANVQELNANQRAVVLNAIALNEQLNPAVNDFAETSSGFANQTRIMKTQLQEVAAAIGQQLLPYATQLLGWVSQAITWFQQLSPETQKWIVVIGGVVAAVGPLLMILGSLITAGGAVIGVIGAISAPVLIVIAVIAALVAIAYVLYKAWTENWNGIRQKTAAAIDFIKAIFSGWIAFFQVVLTNIKLIAQAFQAAFHGDWYRFGQLLRQAWDNAWRAIGQILSLAWSNLRSTMSNLANNIITFFRTADWGSIGRNIIQGIANGIRAGIGIITSAARSAAQAALAAAKGFLGIRSPSRLFEMEVGLQMAQGTALGWERGLERFVPGMMPQLAPAGIGVAGLGGLSGGAGGDQIDYYKLARIVRDAVLMRSE